jgi:hypothetical protein
MSFGPRGQILDETLSRFTYVLDSLAVAHKVTFLVQYLSGGARELQPESPQTSNGLPRVFPESEVAESRHRRACLFRSSFPGYRSVVVASLTFALDMIT